MRNKKSILLVEDDTVDVMTIKRAFKDLRISNELIVRGNGEEALEYLQSGENEFPCLILLDLNMPRMNGIEFLKAAKQDDKIKMIPVIVLTTSNQDQDKVESFRLSVAGYMVKPVEYMNFVEVMRAIDMYWTISDLPD
jgi:CheY-like chemotaxis protein